MKAERKLVGLGILTAVSASLCCIAPVLALLAGTTGLASAFSWMAPLRPYLISVTILLLGLAWYQKLKPKKENQDACCVVRSKTSFLQSKKFLGITTVLGALLLAFPLYENVFYTKAQAQQVTALTSNLKTAEFTIEGMTCSSCEKPVSNEVHKLNGIQNATVSYDHGNAIVTYDSSQTNLAEIQKSIEETGYIVTAKKGL